MAYDVLNINLWITALLVSVVYIQPTLQQQDETTSSCGGHFYGPHGVIKSPNYPNNYDNSIKCTYVIHVNTTSVVQLTFEDFQTEGCELLCDGVKLYNGDITDTTSGSTMMDILYGLNLTLWSYTSTGHVMSVEFVSDSNNTYRGFKAIYREDKETASIEKERASANPNELAPRKGYWVIVCTVISLGMLILGMAVMTVQEVIKKKKKVVVSQEDTEDRVHESTSELDEHKLHSTSHHESLDMMVFLKNSSMYVDTAVNKSLLHVPFLQKDTSRTSQVSNKSGSRRSNIQANMVASKRPSAKDVNRDQQITWNLREKEKVTDF